MSNYGEQELDMNSFFNQKNIESTYQQQKIVELGHGIGITGHRDGSYSQYIKTLSDSTRRKPNTVISNEKQIYLSNFRLDRYRSTAKAVLSEKIPIDKQLKLSENISVGDIIRQENLIDIFKPGEIPKLLIMFHNVLNDKEIFVTWSHLDKNTRQLNLELEQFYHIQSAYSNGYDWWDSYGVLFLGPGQLKEGGYIIDIKSTDIRPKSSSINDDRITSISSIKFLVNS